MLTVLEAARILRRNPETIRRWIREGRLPASKLGTQYVIDEDDLSLVGYRPGTYAPDRAPDGIADVVGAIRRSRADRSFRIAETVAAYRAGQSAPAASPVGPNGWLPAMIGRIVRLVDPVRVILFGSRARGEAGDDSDYDLLVIVDKVANRRARRIEILRALDDIPTAKDVVVLPVAEVAPVPPRGIARQAMAEGRVVYERR